MSAVKQPVTVSVAVLVGLMVSIGGLIGYGVGVGHWSGVLETTVQAHEKRFIEQRERDREQDQRADRQDMHMQAIDRLAAATRESLAAIERDVALILRTTIPAP